MANISLSITGHWCTSTGVWTIDIALQNKDATPVSSSVIANNAHEYKCKKDIVTYLHKGAFTPVPSTWIYAICAGFSGRGQGLLPTWLQITYQNIRQPPRAICGIHTKISEAQKLTRHPHLILRKHHLS